MGSQDSSASVVPPPMMTSAVLRRKLLSKSATEFSFYVAVAVFFMKGRWVLSGHGGTQGDGGRNLVN